MGLACTGKSIVFCALQEAKKPVETPGPGYYDTKHNTLDNKVQGNEPILVRGQLRKPTYKGLDRTGVQKPYGSQV